MENIPSITVIIYTYNNADQIQECINSAKLLTHDIIILDQESNDQTETIAKENNIQLFSFPHVEYVEPARKAGIQQAQGQWVMILDADERITQELAIEIQSEITKTTHTHYKLPRKNIFAHSKWLKHGGWWPDAQMRLINTSSFQDWPERIHSTPIITGSQGILQNPFLHYFHGDITTMVEKTIKYEGIESDLLFNAGRSVSIPMFFRKFLMELYRRLIKNKGYKDGNIGIIESIYQAYSKTITWLYLYEKKNCSTV
ncbi:MAG: glycosyltransferase family 2 protein [Candidatus Roizmanbacteria bacterium]